MADQHIFTLLFVGILWGCVLGLQRPAPRYSQQLMPDTAFTCRHKIVGSYYADPETDCQLFHVCVSVAGSIQDYRFLCPNDTAFDQESQTCADWYDVDCEAATLYYASDNFDLYRLGSGLESLHYDSVRNDVDSQDHLQRSESSDPVRSSVNNLNRVAASSNTNNNNNNNNNNRDILRGSSSSNFFNNRNNGKEEDYDNEKVYREEPAVESRRQQGVRKVARKQQYNNNNSNNISPTTSSPQNYDNQNRNNNYQNNGNAQRQTKNNFVSSTTPRPLVSQENNNFVRNNQNGNQRYTVPSSTYRPTTENSYQDNNNNGFNTNQQANFNNFNSNKFSNTQQNFGNTNLGQSPAAAVSSTLRPTDYTQSVSNKKKTTEQTSQSFANQYNSQFNQFSTQSTTSRPSTNFQSTDYTAYQQKSYNNIQRSTKPAAVDFPTTTIAPTFYDDYAIAARLSDPQIINKVSTTRKQEATQTTPRFVNNFAGSSYIPTTYSPVTKKQTTNGNGNGNGNGNNNQGQVTNRGNDQYTGQYEAARTTNSGQYQKTTQQTSQVYKNTQSYDTNRPNFNNNDNNGQYRDATRSPKKVTQFNNYDAKVNFEGSTKSSDNFDQGKAAASATGFSPASVNKLAETTVTLRPTTPFSRAHIRDHTVYNNPNTQRPASLATKFEAQTTLTPRTGSYVSATPRPFSSTSRSSEQQNPTTAKPKTGKKNDYDYAYYDNAGALEYDGVDLEQVTGSRDSAKISRN